MGLDMHIRQALTDQLAQRYRGCTKKERSRILDEFVKTTEYNRTYASHLLSNWGKVKLLRLDGKLVRIKAGQRTRQAVEHRGRKRTYDEELQEALIRVWAVYDLMCGKRLVVAMRAVLASEEFRQAMGLSETIRGKLMSISASTVDRLLREERQRAALKGMSHTRRVAGPILRRIPVQTYAEQPGEPGFFQVDLVGHEGGEAQGEFCYTLNATDPATQWCEPRAVKNKAGRWTTEALEWIQENCPVPLRGWHTDCGSEFLNAHMERYCREHDIVFTRSRFGKKNDNCWVEQKNDAVVRNAVGYLRYEGEVACLLLNELYDALRILVNFFYPSQKLLKKQRIGSKVKKRYDTPKTPYQRLIDSGVLDEQAKERLRSQMRRASPLELRRKVNEKTQQLLKLAETMNRKSRCVHPAVRTRGGR